MKIVSDSREAMWGVVQQGISTIDFDYAGLRRRALRPPASRNASTPGYRAAVQTP